MDSTDESLFLCDQGQGFKFRYTRNSSDRYKQHQIIETSQASVKSLCRRQFSETSKSTVRGFYRKTQRNLQNLVENMFKQFRETIPPEPVPPEPVIPEPKLVMKQRVRPSTAIRDKKIRVSIQRNLHLQNTFQANEDRTMVSPQTQQAEVVTSPVPKNREKMLQQLLDKLESHEKSLVRSKVRPISSHVYSKRPPPKLVMQRDQTTKALSHSVDGGGGKHSQRYQIQEVLGAGAYAQVKKAMDTLTDKHVAIKTYERNKLFAFERRQVSLHEVRILQRLDHPGVIKLLNVLQTKHSISLILEYCGHRSLYMVLKGIITQQIHTKEKVNHRFAESDFKGLFRQIVQAVEHCHNRDVAHRDIKIENILLNNGQIKLIDFGLASIGPPSLLTTHCGTPSYMPPEVCQRRPYKGSLTDVWALGIVLYVSLVGKFPFEGKGDDELFKSIINQKLKLPGHLSVEAKHLLTCILQKEPLKRPQCSQILTQSWLL